jgi:hypothetical protein
LAAAAAADCRVLVGKLSLRWCAHRSCTALLASNALAASSAVSNVTMFSFTFASFLMVAWKRPDSRLCTPRYLQAAIAHVGERGRGYELFLVSMVG